MKTYHADILKQYRYIKSKNDGETLELYLEVQLILSHNACTGVVEVVVEVKKEIGVDNNEPLM